LKVALLGDVMTGRLIDQIFPTHSIPDTSEYKDSIHLNSWSKPHSYIWGDLLPVLRDADVRIANLETSITTNSEKWPRKAFNYRMHPDNIGCLTVAKLDFCSLANNHILDYCVAGMQETKDTLRKHNIKFAGAGVNISEAITPAIVYFSGLSMACFSFSDHYEFWRASETQAGINFLDPEDLDESNRKNEIRKLKQIFDQHAQNVDLISVSFHWGPNYRWAPTPELVSFAHDLIDICGVDIIHGHSSHHIQGIEIYKGKPIIYGCGDFLDDYAVDTMHRNDLSFLYLLHLDPDTTEWKKVELIPTCIKAFQVNKAVGRDREWLLGHIKSLSEPFGTTVLSNFEIPITPVVKMNE